MLVLMARVTIAVMTVMPISVTPKERFVHHAAVKLMIDQADKQAEQQRHHQSHRHGKNAVEREGVAKGL